LTLSAAIVPNASRTPNVNTGKRFPLPRTGIGKRMTNIDRRKLLSSLAATTVCAPVVSTINAADATARRGAIHEGGQSCDGLFLARESRQQLTNHAIDFWARPLSDIAYTQYLPREIARGAMWYEASDRPSCPTLEAIDRSFRHHCFDWADRPRRFAVHLDGIETLSSTLRSLIEDGTSSLPARTAFLSLDSIGPLREPGWADVLPAFKSCYERIIGHFHLEQRGLRQWRQFLNGHFGSENEGGYFQEFFTDAAVQCDAVVVTSPALIESDLNCCPRASTEELVGELMRHFGCALLTPAVNDQIVGGSENRGARNPRLFALASLTLETMDDYYIHFPRMIRRQADLIRGSFGDAIPGERFLLVATAGEHLCSDLVDEIRQTVGTSFFTTTTPAYEVDKRGYGILSLVQLIALWPFDFDEAKLRAS
jgi:hypothetical protein